MKLLLVRHGQTDWNTAMRTQGLTNIPLNAAGRLQAQRLSGRLQGRDICAVYASPLLRAQQTAAPAAALLGLSIQEEPLLIERNFGDWEGVTFDKLQELYPEELGRWRTDPMNCTPPGAEPLEDVLERCRRFIASLTSRHSKADTVLVVGHSVPLRMILADALALPGAMLHAIRIDNCALSCLQLEPVMLTLLNDAAHLEYAL